MRSRSLAYDWASRSLARACTASLVLRRCCGLSSLCPSLRVQRAESAIPPIEQTKSGLNPSGCSDEDDDAEDDDDGGDKDEDDGDDDDDDDEENDDNEDANCYKESLSSTVSDSRGIQVESFSLSS